MDSLRTSDMEGLIGNTPLVRLRPFESKQGVELYAKLESRNPGGSVKDRPALFIVREALAARRLGAGVRLLDATSGNTGIAYAMLGAALGFGVTLCLPESASPERKRILGAYGAELIPTDAADGSDGAILEAQRLARQRPREFYYADQYSNDANPRAHYETTGPEVWNQTEGRVSHFVAGLGTTGTLMGAGRFLKEQAASVATVGVQPDGPFHGLEGLKHLETAMVPGVYDPAQVDQHVQVSTEEAQHLVKRLAREAGILAGVSSGAALGGALQATQHLESGVIVMVFPDGGDKYLSERFWEETGVGGSAMPLSRPKD